MLRIGKMKKCLKIIDEEVCMLECNKRKTQCEIVGRFKMGEVDEERIMKWKQDIHDEYVF